MRVAKDGGWPETLSSGHGCPCYLSVASGTVYFTAMSDGSIHSVPASGGWADTLVSGQPSPSWIASDGSTVFWTYQGSNGANFLDGDARSAPAGGGVETVLASGNISPRGIATDGGYVFFTSRNITPGGPDEVYRMSTSGAGLTAIVSFASNLYSPLKVQVLSGWVYWADHNMGVYRVQTNGSGQAQIVDGGVRLMASDGEYVYVTTYDYVFRKRISGGGLEQLVEAMWTSPYDIDVDASAIYWTDDSQNDPKVYKLRKQDIP